MFAYKTNSADYLDYVASVKSRKEIQADPDLCLLLENPYIKDNMEMAIRWNEARYGDYQDKYDFMQYFFCNGPELDADTILHYRMKAYNDPVCMEIAYSYLSDTQHLSEIRQNKYNKQTDNCFKNPCFYMGKFSAMMGSCGDSQNTRSAFNSVSRWWNAVFDNEKKKAVIAQQQVDRGQRDGATAASGDKPAESGDNKPKDKGTVIGSDDKVKPGGTAPSKTPTKAPDPAPVGGMRKAFDQVIIPSMKKGWNMMWAQILQGDQAFTRELIDNKNTALNGENIGDTLCQPISEMLDLVTKANVKRQMGDCARLWSQVRRMRLFGSENKYGPIVASQIVGNTNTDGTPKAPLNNPQPSAAEASSTVAAAKNAKGKITGKKTKAK